MIPFPDKKYKVIYADPPWSYDNKVLGRDLNAGADFHYKTMPLEDIKALPIERIKDKDCCLFLWAVNPQMPEACEVMKAWGFKYKTMLTWYKLPGHATQAGLGYWFRGYTEHLLFGIRGEVPAFKLQKSNIIRESIREHSRKPDSFRRLIECATEGLEPKIELFARMKPFGWDAWGNEVEDLPTLEQYTL